MLRVCVCLRWSGRAAVPYGSRGATMKRMRERVGGLVLAVGMVMMAASAAGCHRYRAPVPLGELTAEQTAGHAVFQAQCAQCHEERVDRAKNGPALVSLFQKPALHSGAAATDERVTATVMRGHGVMPAMGDRVDEQQMAELLAYLHTL